MTGKIDKSPCNGAKLQNGDSNDNGSSTRRSKRSHIPVDKFFIDTPIKKKLGNNSPSSSNSAVYMKGDYLAVRNDTESFYLCIALQNIYQRTTGFILQWLTCKSGNVYYKDYVDKADVQTILAEVNLTKKGKTEFILPESQQEIIFKSLLNSVKAEKGILGAPAQFNDKVKIELPVNNGIDVNGVKPNGTSNGSASSHKRKYDDAVVQLKVHKSKKPRISNGGRSPAFGHSRKSRHFPVEILNKDPTFSSSEEVPPISVLADSKVTLKAVRTKNYDLLKKALEDHQHISDVSVHRSLNCSDNAFKEAILNEDHRALAMLFDYVYSTHTTRVSIPNDNYIILKAQSTLNKKDCNVNSDDSPVPFIEEWKCSNDNLRTALQNGVSYETLQLIITENGHTTEDISSELFDNVFESIRHGHMKLSQQLIDKAVNNNTPGFTHMFSEILKPSPDLSQIQLQTLSKEVITSKEVNMVHCAAINLNGSALSLLLCNSPNSSSLTDADGNQPIHYAAASFQHKTTNILIDRGVSIYEQNKKGESALYIACKLGRFANAEILLKTANELESTKTRVKDAKKINLKLANLPCKKCFTPLMIAAKKGHHQIIELLLKFKCNIEDETNYGTTALMFACQQGHLSCVKLLVSKAQLDYQDEIGRTALIHAVINGQAHIVSHLIHEGADPHSTDLHGNGVVHYAAAYGWWHCLKLVIEAGANTNTFNQSQLTPIALAALKNQTGIVSYLLNIPSFDVNTKFIRGQSLLMFMLQSHPSEHLRSLVEFVINKMNADVTFKDANHNNCLHHIASNKHFKLQNEFDNLQGCAQLLIEKGCSLTETNDQQCTPFHIAIRNCCWPIVSLLLDKNSASKVTFVAPNSKENMLHLVASCYDKTTVFIDYFKNMLTQIDRQLEGGKLNIMKMSNQRDGNGLTPLMTLCDRIAQLDRTAATCSITDIHIIKMFLDDFKCNVNDVKLDGSDDTPFHILAGVYFTELLSVLLDRVDNLNVFNKAGYTPLHVAILNECNLNLFKMLEKGCDAKLWTRSATEPNFTPLLYSSKPENLCLAKIEVLLENDTDPMDSDPHTKKSVLHNLVSVNPEDQDIGKFERCLSLALESCADVNIQDKDGRTALHDAVETAMCRPSLHTNIVDILLENQLNANAIDKYGKTALHYVFTYYRSVIKEQLDPVEMTAVLVDRTDVNVADSNGNTCLHLAALCGTSTSAHFICKKIADINAKNKEGLTALDLAVEGFHKRCTFTLIEHCTSLPHYSLLKKIVGLQWMDVICEILRKFDAHDQILYDFMKIAVEQNQLNLALKLVRRANDCQQLFTINGQDQSLLHLIALMECASTDSQLQIQVMESLINKGLPASQVDSYGATPLLYSCMRHNYYLSHYLALQVKLCQPDSDYKDIGDKFERTIMSSVFWLFNDKNIPCARFLIWMKEMVEKGLKVDVLTRFTNICKVFENKTAAVGFAAQQMINPTAHANVPRISPLIYAVISQIPQMLNIVLEFHPDLNFVCQNGRTALMYAVIINDIAAVKLLLNKKHVEQVENTTNTKDKPTIPGLVNGSQIALNELTNEDVQFSKQSIIDLQKTDANGKNVVHYLIGHHQFGSFDNLRLLQLLLSCGFKAADDQWRQYMTLADSCGAVKICRFLSRLIGNSPKKSSQLNFKVNDAVSLPGHKFSFEDDAHAVITRMNPQYCESDQPIRPNPDCECGEQGEVIIDCELNIPFSIKMSKFDVDNGMLGSYNFYLMQVIYSKMLDKFILFSKWGKIGSDGQYQNTSFSSKDDAIQEFMKIFKNKTGNNWKDVKNFQILASKYRIVNSRKRYEVSTRCAETEKCNDMFAKSKLNEHLKHFLLKVSDLKMLRNQWHDKIGGTTAPFGMLNKADFLKAKVLLEDIKVTVAELEKLKELYQVGHNAPNANDFKAKSFDIHRQIEKLSEEVYSLLPLSRYYHIDNNDMLKPITTSAEVNFMLHLTDQLVDFDSISKLILAAYSRNQEVHPMDYIYSCLRCKLELLDAQINTYSCIQKYIHACSPKTNITGIYKVQLDGVEVNESNMDNHKLLWYHIKLENILNVFKNGLKSSPITAINVPNTLFKGVCFSDDFSVCDEYDNSDSFRVAFLCQVALGRSKCITNANQHEILEANYDSFTIGESKFDSNYDFYLSSPHGAALPMRKKESPANSSCKYYVLNKNQLCIRYMVLFKN